MKWLRRSAEQAGIGQRALPGWLRAVSLAVLAVALGIAAWLLVHNWQAVRAYSWSLRWWPLVVAMPLYPLAIGLVVYAWTLMIRRLGGKVRFGESYYAIVLSNLARKLPTPLWFLGGRVLFARTQGVPEALSSTALIVEQTLSLLASIVVAVLAGLIGGVSLAAGVWRWLLAAGAGGCLALLAWPGLVTRAVNAIMRRLGSEQKVDGRIAPKDMVTWLALFMLSCLLSGIAYCLVVLALHPVEFALWPALISFSAFGGAISFLSLVLPAGLGLREAATAAMLAAIVPVPVAMAAPLLSRLWYLANELLWAGLVALAHALVLRRHAKAQNNPNG